MSVYPSICLSFCLSAILSIHPIPCYICLFITVYCWLWVCLSLSSLVSSRFSPHMVPHPSHGLHQTGIPHPAIVSPAIKQEPNGDNGSNSTHGWVSVLHYSLTVLPLLFSDWHHLCIHLCPYRKPSVPVKKEEEKKPHIKKPLNAFMLYMKEMRAKVVAECTLKESAAINQILGRRVSAYNSHYDRSWDALVRFSSSCIKMKIDIICSHSCHSKPVWSTKGDILKIVLVALFRAITSFKTSKKDTKTS